MLDAGDKLGPYEILSPIGAGGMGEVYRARDTKLKRDVALKVLPDAFARDPGRMARFQREAEVLASLNHPNIAQIYGFDEQALVMELVEGESPKGPMPFDDAWKIALQMADALEYAHERGVIHRDLKPANVKVTPDGVVKLLDFGLAKAFGETPEAASLDPENSPTVTLGATVAGTVLGTAAYMSPEQAEGKRVDKRADIWSWGVVLHELLTGERLFKGKDASDTLAQVLAKEPNLERVPQKVRKLLRRCLERDPKRRLRDIGDAMPLIDDAPQIETQARAAKLPWTVTAVAVLFAAAGWWYATRPAPLRPLMSLNLDLADETPLASGDTRGSVIALSPDGARLALVLRGADGKVHLHTRLLHENHVTSLAGTENASFPFFSPDGEWIGFFADGKLKKISAEGGAAIALCDASNPVGASWGDDGNIIAALKNVGGLSRVPSAGGTPVPVTKLSAGEDTHRWPQVLPGSQAVLFTAGPLAGDDDATNIDVASLKTGGRKTVQRGGSSPRYMPTSTGIGYLVYLHQNTLAAVPFNPGRLALAGVPTTVLEDVSSNIFSEGGEYALSGVSSGPGTFVYLAAKRQPAGWGISWLDSAGKTEPLHAPIGRYFVPRFSPDGKRLAFAAASVQQEDIWVKDLDRATPSRLSLLDGMNRWPVWSPDGKNIVFKSMNPTAPGLYWIRSDGSGETQRLTDGKLDETPYSFSPEGKYLAFYRIGNGGSQDILTAPIEGEPGQGTHGVRLGKAELFVGTQFNEVHPAFSPDGRWLAYSSNESGTYEVYVRAFPGPGRRWTISTGGGFLPLWSRDGHELLFETPDGDRRVMTVNYTAKGDYFVADKPRVWSKTRLLNTSLASNYDLAPDGKRLAALVDEASGEKPPTHLTVLLNFSDELRRRSPSGGK